MVANGNWNWYQVIMFITLCPPNLSSSSVSTWPLTCWPSVGCSGPQETGGSSRYHTCWSWREESSFPVARDKQQASKGWACCRSLSRVENGGDEILDVIEMNQVLQFKILFRRWKRLFHLCTVLTLNEGTIYEKRMRLSGRYFQMFSRVAESHAISDLSIRAVTRNGFWYGIQDIDTWFTISGLELTGDHVATSLKLKNKG